MCGIFCVLALKSNEKIVNNIQKSCENFIHRRGPDHQSTITFDQKIKNEEVHFSFMSSVLWLQGENLTTQPLTTQDSIFLYNGDVFDGINDEEKKKFGDTKLLFDQIERSNNISLELSKINGPYAFIYLDKKNSKLYFGCDKFGRRSLLIGKKNDVLVLSSVVSKEVLMNFIEVPPIGTFCYDLELNEFIIYPWGFRNNDFNERLSEMEDVLNINVDLIQNIPLNDDKNIFREPTEDDLKMYFDVKTNQNVSPFETLLNNEKFSKNVSTLLEKLENSIKKRIINQPKFCKECIFKQSSCNHATIGILFSGGIDCTLLAVLVDKFYDKNRPIDLINVAFERDGNFNTPDRETGLQSWEELKSIRPDRIWNFIEVNVPKNELDQIRKDHIKHLIHPLNRILDDSLGCALWFAARGVGENYTTSSRVLIVGMGADELFGGYIKHRGQLKEAGWKGLHETLEADFVNIPKKNLVRDDRVVSDHGRQLRTPYLDENVVEFAQSLHCWEKTYPTDDFPRGLGEKILLRALAYKLGLKNASTLIKRALQFGCRIADHRENAYHVSPRLL